jgi:hypothetical protein
MAASSSTALATLASSGKVWASAALGCSAVTTASALYQQRKQLQGNCLKNGSSFIWFDNF